MLWIEGEKCCSEEVVCVCEKLQQKHMKTAKKRQNKCRNWRQQQKEGRRESDASSNLINNDMNASDERGMIGSEEKGKRWKEFEKQ